MCFIRGGGVCSAGVITDRHAEVLTVRGRSPRGLKTISDPGTICFEAQVEQVGLWENGVGEGVSTQAYDQRRG